MLLFLSVRLQAGVGYHIHLKMTDMKDSLVYLVHYYGKGRPRIFISDSVKLNHLGVAEFSSSDPDFAGGIYIILFRDTAKTNFELLLNKGDNISVTATRSRLPDGVQFKNAPENERFEEYVDYLKGYSAEQEKLKKQLAQATTQTDTEAVRKKSVVSAKVLTQYRRDYIKAHPGALLSSVFSAMETPEIPEGAHLLEDGKTKDSTFAYRYYKQHYWDGWDFKDDRLVFTPLYDSRLEEYFSKLVLPWPDSVEKEADNILRKCRGTKDMFHYTLWWITRYAEESKVMGMDEAFVYLVENYYMKGDAFWLSNDELQKYEDRASRIAPNVCGNIAPEIKLPNVVTGKEESLLATKAKYTLIIFYSPNCGHCQHEMPQLDSLYRAVLKKKGVKVFTVATETTDTTIRNFVTKNNMQEWTNTWDPQQKQEYKFKYDVYSTPTIYLLDEHHKIRGKRLDHTNISGVIDMVERKEKEKKETGRP